MVALTELGAPAAVLRACSVSRRLRDPADLVGAALDVAVAAARAAASCIPAAYALDSVLIELIFILGPLLTARSRR